MQACFFSIPTHWLNVKSIKLCIRPYDASASSLPCLTLPSPSVYLSPTQSLSLSLSFSLPHACHVEAELHVVNIRQKSVEVSECDSSQNFCIAIYIFACGWLWIFTQHVWFGIKILIVQACKIFPYFCSPFIKYIVTGKVYMPVLERDKIWLDLKKLLERTQ